MTDENTNFPELVVQIEGKVIDSNFIVFQDRASRFISNIKTKLESEDDFATAKQHVKLCSKIEKDLSKVIDSILSQTSDVKKLVDDVGQIKENFVTTRLKISKLVESEEKRIKEGAIEAAVQELNDFVKVKNESIDPFTVAYSFGPSCFSAAIKGKRTRTTLDKALKKEILELKSKIMDHVSAITYNKNFYESGPADYNFLFPDLDVLIDKDRDEFKEIIEGRIAKFKLEEAEEEKQVESLPKFDETPLNEQKQGNEQVFDNIDTNTNSDLNDPANRVYIDPKNPLSGSDCNNDSYVDQHELINAQPEPENTFASYVGSWYELKDELAALKAKELEMRKAIASFVSDSAGKPVGTSHYLLDDQYELVCSIGTTSKVDEAVFQSMRDVLRGGGYNPDLLVKWAPVLVKTEYEKLPEDVKVYFDGCLTTTPSSPKLTVKQRTK